MMAPMRFRVRFFKYYYYNWTFCASEWVINMHGHWSFKQRKQLAQSKFFNRTISCVVAPVLFCCHDASPVGRHTDSIGMRSHRPRTAGSDCNRTPCMIQAVLNRLPDPNKITHWSEFPKRLFPPYLLACNDAFTHAGVCCFIAPACPGVSAEWRCIAWLVAANELACSFTIQTFRIYNNNRD